MVRFYVGQVQQHLRSLGFEVSSVLYPLSSCSINSCLIMNAIVIGAKPAIDIAMIMSQLHRV